MKRETFEAKGLRVETWRDYNGRHFICWKPLTSVYISGRKELLRFIAWPPKTPTGDSLRSWLDSLQATDAEREARSHDPQAELPSTGDLLATGFGPECHLDEGDPNFQTKTVI